MPLGGTVRDADVEDTPRTFRVKLAPSYERDVTSPASSDSFDRLADVDLVGAARDDGAVGESPESMTAFLPSPDAQRS